MSAPFASLIATQCFPPVLGGIENFMHGLAQTLGARGSQTTVLADGKEEKNAAGEAPFTLLRFSGLKALRRRRKAVHALRQLRAMPAAAVLFADSWKSLEHLPAACAKYARFVCFMHGMEFPNAPAPQKAQRIARALAKADVLFANSHYTAQKARPFLREGARVHVVQPCISPCPIPEPALRAALRQRLGGGPVLATVCRLEPRKGVDQTLRALALLKNEFPSLTYAVGGAGGDRERLEALAAELQLTDRVHFLGRITEAEKAALLDIAEVFAMPVREEGDSVEGYGAAYIEAGWYGLPCIAGRSGGAVEAVEHGATGLVCADTSPGALATLLRSLLHDDALRARLGGQARQKAYALTWEAGFQRYLDILAAHGVSSAADARAVDIPHLAA